MEEIENRLYSNNTINVSHLISKIVSNVKKKHENGLKDFLEIKFLKDKFMSDDPLVSEISGIGIKQLIKDGVLSLDIILADLLSTLNSTKCFPSLINMLGDLLYLQLQNRVTNYNLSNLQHPFITLIIENPDVSNNLLIKINNMKNEFPRSDVQKLFLPFYLFVICCPAKSSLFFVKYRLWNSLLNTSSIDDLPTEFYKNLISWLQVERKEDLPIINDQLMEAVHVSLENNNFLNSELLIVWQVNVLYNLAKNKLDMQHLLTNLKKVLSSRKLITIDCILLIVSQIVDTCSPLYLKDVLTLCEILIDQNNPSVYAVQTLRASILQWIASPCILTEEACQVATKLLNEYTESVDLEKKSDLKRFYEENKYMISTNKIIFLAVNISIQLEIFNSEEDAKDWLEELKKTPVEFKLDIFNFLCGVLMVNNKNPDISIDILEILLDCTSANIYLTAKLLTLIFYKISNNQQPKFHFSLLKSLPKMVVLRENIPKVIATIQAISKGSENLFNVSLSLAYDVWNIDNKCYTYLEDLLVSNPPAKKKWERYVIKGFILKQLCEKKPELYGRDITAHLSKILNECDDENGALPCSLAIDAIIILCRAGIIDVKTTWANLSPKFRNDFRYPVVKSLCSMIEEIPQISYSEPYQVLFEEVTKQLWAYVDLGDPQMSNVALSSLAAFGMEHISKSLPGKYLEPESVSSLNSVTGKTWIHFLIENGCSAASLKFIQKMVSREIDEYLKYVYQSKGPKEPVNYSYLPSYSVVRSLGEFIKTWVNKWKGSIHDKLYLECLKIFSVEYSKPLPPLDWCFLQELIHDTRTKEYSIDIASHQVVLSGTARRLIENYIIAVTEKPQDDDVINVFRNLRFLSRSIQPMILRPFFEISIWDAIKKYNKNEKSLLNDISQYIKVVLKLSDVQETNKLTIVQVLDSILFVIDIDSQLFEDISEILITAPSNCLKDATNVKIVDNEENFKKAAKIRCALARGTNMLSLVWLDDVIGVWSTHFRNLQLWPDFSAVFRIHITNTDECIPWILELIGQIQAKIADRCDVPVVSFLFDILIFAIVILSGHFVFLRENIYDETELKTTFPQSLASLLDRSAWEVCSIQVLEWLYHMNTEDVVPTTYRRIFGICLQALKHNEEFVKNQRWLKYLNSCTNFK